MGCLSLTVVYHVSGTLVHLYIKEKILVFVLIGQSGTFLHLHDASLSRVELLEGL